MGLGGQTGTIRDQSKAAVAPATTQFHWQDPSLSTESSRGEKPSAWFSVLGVAGSSLGGTSYPNTDWSGSSFLLQDACENIIGIEPYKKNIIHTQTWTKIWPFGFLNHISSRAGRQSAKKDEFGWNKVTFLLAIFWVESIFRSETLFLDKI